MNMETNERYSLSVLENGLYKAMDNRTGVYVTFEEKKFEQTQKWYFSTSEELNRVKLVRICDGLEAWINWHHRDIMAEADKYEIKLSEDGKTVTVVRFGTPGRYSDPRIEVSFPAETSKKVAAAKISNLAKFLKSYAGDWHDGNF